MIPEEEARSWELILEELLKYRIQGRLSKGVPRDHGSSLQVCHGRLIITQILPGPHSSVPAITLVLPPIDQSAPQVATVTGQDMCGSHQERFLPFFVLCA